MELKEVIFSVKFNGEYYKIRLTFSEPAYIEVVPFAAWDYGDRNFRQHGLVGYPWAYNVITFKLKYKEKEYYLVCEEHKLSKFTETTTYQFQIDDLQIEVETDLADWSNVFLYTPEEFSKYIEYTDEYDR